jgi:hypothetical protein
MQKLTGTLRAGAVWQEEGLMGEPEVGRDYYFVRRSNEGFSVAQFKRFADGRAILFVKDRPLGVWENDPDAWKSALRDIQRDCYVELGDAIRAGLLTKDAADELLG